MAVSTQSCMTYTEKIYTASDYGAREAYNLGYRDGSSDRARGKSHNPHINEPYQTPSSYRQDYIWGYTHGYRGMSPSVSGSK